MPANVESILLQQLADQLITNLAEIDSTHRQFAILVAPASVRSVFLRVAAGRAGLSWLNLSLELSRALLEQSRREYSAQVRPILSRLVRNAAGGTKPIMLDRLEFLFEPVLGHDPLNLLKTLARERNIIAAWPGELDAAGTHLVYARPGHPAYHAYPTEDIVILTPFSKP